MRKFMSHCRVSAAIRFGVALAATVLAAAAAQAAPIELGSFHLLNASQSLSFTNNGGVSASLSAISVPVIFNFTTQSGLSTADHSALLTINPVGTLPTTVPAVAAGSLLDQPINPLRFSIIETGTGKNLLSMSSTGGDITGLSGAVNADLSGTHTAVYSSDFGTFSASTAESFNFGVATMSAALSAGPGGFLNSFIANLNGQFSVDSTGFIPTPEPASVVLFGMGLFACAAFIRRSERR
jgi:hypothetical protein